MRSQVSDLASSQDARLIAACFLALVLAWSGFAKLRDLRGTAGAIAAFDVGLSPLKTLASLLASLELVAAIALVTTPLVLDAAAPAVATGVALLFAVFAVLLGRVLRSGRALSCHCFGSDARPVSKSSIARAAALCLLAVYAATGTGAQSGQEVVVALVAGAALLGAIVVVASARRMAHFNTHLRAIGGR